MVSLSQGYMQISACRMEFHTVAIVGRQAMPDLRQTEEKERRQLYVVRLVLAVCGEPGAIE